MRVQVASRSFFVGLAVLVSGALASGRAGACDFVFGEIPTARSQCGGGKHAARTLFFESDPGVLRAPSGLASVIDDGVVSGLLEKTRALEANGSLGSDAGPERAFRVDLKDPTLTISTGTAEDASLAPCQVELDQSVPDEPPPAFVSIGASIDYIDGGSSGCLFCGEVDTLHVSATPPVDTKRPPYFVVYFGATAPEASTKPDPDAMGALPAPTGSFDITLGSSNGHLRTGLGFRRYGLYCFSLAPMSETGLIGPRSTPECLDSTNPEDPHVIKTPKASCACATPGRALGGSSFAGALALVVSCAAAVRRIGRRQPRLSGPRR